MVVDTPPTELDSKVWDIGRKSRERRAAIAEAKTESGAETVEVETDASITDQKPATKTDDLDDDLIEQAVGMGIRVSQAREMGAKALRAAMGIISARSAEPAEKSTAAKPARVNLDPFAAAIPEFATSLDEGTVDDGIVKDIKGLAGHTNTYLKALQNGIGSFRNEVQAELFLNRVEQFDSMVEGLGKDWEPTFGKGEQSDLNPNSQEIHARARLFDAVSKIRDESRRNGEAISAKKAFNQALGQAFKDQSEAVKLRKDEAARRSAQSKHIARPTHREPLDTTTDAKDRGEAFATGFLKERGFTVRNGTANSKRRI